MKRQSEQMIQPPQNNAMRHVLLVEDDHSHAELIRRAFEPQGQSINVTIVYSLQAAYETIRTSSPDLIIADLRLPDGLGIDLLSSDSSEMAYPIVIMTSYGDEHVAVEAIKAGALDYIVKSNMSLLDMPRIAERALREWDHILEHQRVEKELRQYREHLEELVTQRTEELVRAKEIAEEARIAAETANQAKSRFLSNMSHELRTPLNAILGFAQLMRRDPLITPTHQDYLDTIMRSGEHLFKLINDVLDVAKIEIGRLILRSQPFDLWQTLKHIEEMIRSRAAHKGLQFVVTRAPEVPRYIKTDEGKLQQILLNLLSNAVKFTEQGEVLLTIEACSERSRRDCQLNSENSSIVNPFDSAQDRLQFSISDTGIGIAPDELEHIFDPFVQSSGNQQNLEGTGLGLAISRQFVQLLGGQLTAASQPGQGSVFTFTIQTELVDATQVKDHHPYTRVVGLTPNQHAPDGRPYRILIAEDKDFNRLLLQRVLESLDAASGADQILEVRTVVDGQEALATVQHWRPHLIFMDMRMPIMDGYEATRRIRAWERQMANDALPSPFALRPIPIIALTAQAFEEDRKKVLTVGCNDFIRKPFKEQELVDKITTYLGLQFVYEEGERTKSERQRVNDKGSLTPEALVALPPGLLTKLEHAANRNHMQHIAAIIQDIRTHNAAVADALQTLADEFDYDTILQRIHDTKSVDDVS